MLQDFFQRSFLHNTTQAWLIAIAIAFVIFYIIYFIKKALVKRLGKFATKTVSTIDDGVVEVLTHTHSFLILILSLYLGSIYLTFSPKVTSMLNSIALTALLVQFGGWGVGAIKFVLEHIKEERMKQDPSSASIFSVLLFFSRLILWCLLIFVILDNFGVNITALIAGMGVGGIAVALALQNILGDIFCSISILIDKPFEVGDFIIAGSELGTVEKIGIKTTRVRSLSGEQLVFSNTDLVKSRIRNYKRMNERRVLYTFGVVYQTPIEKLEKIPQEVRNIMEAIDKVRVDRVHFKEFADSSLNFECVYYVLDRDYNIYMDIQQKINLDICRYFKSEGIDFAFPSRTIYIEQTSDTNEKPSLKTDQS